MYVKQYRNRSTFHSSVMLCEMTEAQYRRTNRRENQHDQITIKVPASEAHAWVRNGHVHTTSLWVDENGRIRRANPSQ